MTTLLRDPFPTNQIKVKPQSVHEDKGLVTFYVDARLVAERLNECVGPDKWADAYMVITTDPQAGLPVECRLTVDGVTKADVGQIAPGPIDDKAWKSSYSDAFKRAAVKFGIGAYLYESPNIWAEIKIGRNGKAQGFTDAGRAHALSAYAKWIGDSAPVPGASQVSDSAGEQKAAASSPSPSGSAAATSSDGWTWPFGKHKGKSLADTPAEYLEWFLEKSDKEDIKQRIREFQNLAELPAGGGFVHDDDVPF